MSSLDQINRDAFQRFKLRVGKNNTSLLSPGNQLKASYSLRPKPRSRDCRSCGRSETPIRHLGKHRERSVQNGFLRYHGTHTGHGRYGKNTHGCWIRLRVPRTDLRQGQRDADDVLRQNSVRRKVMWYGCDFTFKRTLYIVFEVWECMNLIPTVLWVDLFIFLLKHFAVIYSLFYFI